MIPRKKEKVPFNLICQSPEIIGLVDAWSKCRSSRLPEKCKKELIEDTCWNNVNRSSIISWPSLQSRIKVVQAIEFAIPQFNFALKWIFPLFLSFLKNVSKVGYLSLNSRSPFMTVCWWILEVNPLKLMKSRGRLPFCELYVDCSRDNFYGS